MSKNFCKSCGKIIQGKSDFCSEDCKKSLNELSSNLFSSNTKKCLKCGKSYENKPSKFCSLDCATTYSLIHEKIS